MHRDVLCAYIFERGKTMKSSIPRHLATVLVVLFFFTGCKQQNKPASAVQHEHPVYDGTIVAVGDSLTAGLGVNEEDAYPAQLEKKLREAGYNWRVINAGISGETSSGTLMRVTWVLKLKPDIVILETGANDGLRGIDPRITRRNIDETARLLKKSNVVVVLAGMRMVTNMGRKFTDDFFSNYAAVAGKYDLILIPFFLAGVAGDPTLNQADGIHPTAEGYRIVTEIVYPFALRAIKRVK
jgi:acyl-CoA thioesterase I